MKYALIKHTNSHVCVPSYIIQYIIIPGIFFNRTQPSARVSCNFFAPARSLGYNDQGEVPRNVRPPLRPKLLHRPSPWGRPPNGWTRLDAQLPTVTRIFQFSGKRNMWIIFWRNKKGGNLKEGFFGGKFSSSCEFLFPHLQVM